MFYMGRNNQRQNRTIKDEIYYERKMSKMKKLFISQPMRDKTNDEIEKERKDARIKAEVTMGEVEILDSFFKDAPHDAKPLWYLGEAIKLLGEADIAYFCKDWEHYRGCVIEHECAVRYGIPCIYA